MSEQLGAFDPYAILHALESTRVAFVLIGALARVLHGSDEATAGVDPGDLVRMLEALGRPDQVPHLEAMRRVVELDRGIGLDFSA